MSGDMTVDIDGIERSIRLHDAKAQELAGNKAQSLAQAEQSGGFGSKFNQEKLGPAFQGLHQRIADGWGDAVATREGLRDKETWAKNTYLGQEEQSAANFRNTAAINPDFNPQDRRPHPYSDINARRDYQAAQDTTAPKQSGVNALTGPQSGGTGGGNAAPPATTRVAGSGDGGAKIPVNQAPPPPATTTTTLQHGGTAPISRPQPSPPVPMSERKLQPAGPRKGDGQASVDVPKKQ